MNLAVLQILSLICGTGVLWFYARRFFYRSFQTDRKTVLDMLHFGKYIFGTNVFSALGRSADQFITAGLISADVGPGSIILQTSSAAADSILNAGIIEARNGGTIVLNANVTNNVSAHLDVSGGSRITQNAIRIAAIEAGSKA